MWQSPIWHKWFEEQTCRIEQQMLQKTTKTHGIPWASSNPYDSKPGIKDGSSHSCGIFACSCCFPRLSPSRHLCISLYLYIYISIIKILQWRIRIIICNLQVQSFVSVTQRRTSKWKKHRYQPIILYQVHYFLFGSTFWSEPSPKHSPLYLYLCKITSDLTGIHRFRVDFQHS